MKKILFLFTLAALVSIISINDVFADHSEVTITPTSGSSSPGCQNTSQGCYLPKVASVAVGGKVIFSNPDTVAHTFTAGTAYDDQSGKFDSSLVMAGSSYEWTPTTKGQYDYFCLIHPWMVGIILVGEVTYIPPQPESKIIVSTDTSKYNKGETGTYTLEEALKLQALRAARIPLGSPVTESPPPYLDAGGVGIVIVCVVFGGVAVAFFIR